MLAEANNRRPGRWVIMPRRGERFMGPRGRARTRVRQRRRQVFAVLVESGGLALLIGLFPPLHAMLYLAATVFGLLLVYSALLVRIRMMEATRVELTRLRRARALAEGRTWPSRPAAVRAGERVLAGGRIVVRKASPFEDALAAIAEDVHVVVHRSDELDLSALRAVAAVT